MLIDSDDVLIVATPDLASLRNAKNILDLLRTTRPHDASPKLIMNMVGVPKRPEISVSDFAKALELEPLAAIPFDARLFGAAANNGQMIAEVEEKNKVTEMIDNMAQALMGRTEHVPEKRGLSLPFVSRLMGS